MLHFKKANAVMFKQEKTISIEDCTLHEHILSKNV